MSAPELLQVGDVVESLARRHLPRLSWIVRSVESTGESTQRVHASGRGIGSVIFTWHAPDGVRVGHGRGLTFCFKERPPAASLAERFMARFNCEAEDSTPRLRLYGDAAVYVDAALQAVRPSLDQIAEAIRRDGLVSDSDKWKIAEAVMEVIENPAP